MSFGFEPRQQAPPGHFPGPFAAFVLTIGSVLAVVFATRFVMLLFGAGPSLSMLGVGEALGVGAVATFAAVRVAEPQRERLGLRGFDASFIPWLIMLLPVIVLLSELDNMLRAISPPVDIPAEMKKLQQEFMGSGTLATVEAAIVAIGISPVVEEWLFRGVIQQGLVAHLARARGVLLTAGLYALVHVGPAPSAPAARAPRRASIDWAASSTTGTPAAMASSSASGRPSRRAGWTNTSAAASRAGTSARAPGISTRSSMPRRWARRM